MRTSGLLRRFFGPIVSLPFDDRCAEEAAFIRLDLERSGRPIGPNDLLIAATARAHDLVLVTHNAREFGRVASTRRRGPLTAAAASTWRPTSRALRRWRTWPAPAASARRTCAGSSAATATGRHTRRSSGSRWREPPRCCSSGVCSSGRWPRRSASRTRTTSRRRSSASTAPAPRSSASAVAAPRPHARVLAPARRAAGSALRSRQRSAAIRRRRSASASALQ